MSKKIVGIVVCAAIVAAFGGWLYLTHFYYKKPAYQLAIKNVTDAVIRNANLQLEPSGQFEFGILDPNQDSFHMDPPWPVPQRIIVTFNEDAGLSHQLSLTTGLPKDFQGKLTVLITRTNNVFAAALEKTEGKD